MSDTFDIDAEINDCALENKNHPSTDWVRADFARALKRKLARVTKERDEAENALKAIGYEKHGFGWGIALAEDSKPLAK